MQTWTTGSLDYVFEGCLRGLNHIFDAFSTLAEAAAGFTSYIGKLNVMAMLFRYFLYHFFLKQSSIPTRIWVSIELYIVKYTIFDESAINFKISFFRYVELYVLLHLFYKANNDFYKCFDILLNLFIYFN